jgi:hypothetical protein
MGTPSPIAGWAKAATDASPGAVAAVAIAPRGVVLAVSPPARRCSAVGASTGGGAEVDWHRAKRWSSACAGKYPKYPTPRR